MTPQPGDEREGEQVAFEAMRRANPVGAASVPGPHDARARALFEEIVMQPTAVTGTEPDARSHRPKWAVSVAAAAAAIVVAVGIGIAVSGDDDTPDQSATPDTESPDTQGPPVGLGSCVALYSLETLAEREFAFHGSVASIDGYSVTFEVSEWFRGGDGDTVTLEGGTAVGGAITSAGTATLEVGGDYLVAGDDTFVWDCGFTQAYDASVADTWRDSLSG